MSLMECPECHKEISDTVKKCIYCGYKLEPSRSRRKKNRNIFVIAFSMFCVLGAIIATITINNMQKEKEEQEQMVDNFFENISEFSKVSLEGASKAEKLGNITKKVWNNSIFKIKNDETDLYTRKYGNSLFYENPDTALSLLFSTQDVKDSIEYIENNQLKVEELYKDIRNYPEEYKDYFKSCEEYYDVYTKFTTMVLKPTGTLASYKEKFIELDEECTRLYKKVLTLSKD